MKPRRVGILHMTGRRDTTLALIAVIAAAAVTRLLWLDLMEFKADEAEALRLAFHALGREEPGVGRFFPTAGTTSSLGILFPPLFIYLITIPLAIARDPLAAAAFVAVTNVAAVGLCYVAGKRYFSTFVGLASAAFFALSPWAIVYSRKIWSPDLLPICSCLFLIALHDFLVRKRSLAAVWLILLVGVAVQFHFSAGLLVVLVAAAFALGRDTLRWRYVAAGLGGLILLYVPYLWHIVTQGNVHGSGPTTSIGLSSRLVTSLRDTLAVGFTDRISYVLGSQSPTALPLSVVLGTAAFAGLVTSCRGWRIWPLARARALLALWFTLPLLALTLLPIKPIEHYFVVLYPLPFLGLAVALEAIARRYRWTGRLALAACVVTLAVFDAQLFRTVLKNGGAPGDYGIAYKHKANAVKFFVRQNPTRRFELTRNSAEYRFLEWNLRGAVDKPLLPPVRQYVLSTDFRGRPRHGRPRTKQFGPIQISSLPVRQELR